MQTAVPHFTPERPMRIALVSPRGPLYRHSGGIWKKSLRYAPLTLTTLAALVPDDIPHTVTLVDEGIEDDRPASWRPTSSASPPSPARRRAPTNWPTHFRAAASPSCSAACTRRSCPTRRSATPTPSWSATPRTRGRSCCAISPPDACSGATTRPPGLSLAGRPLPRARPAPGGPAWPCRIRFEATRGCVHRCDFCVVPTAWGRPIQKPVADVVADIRQHEGAAA